MQMFPASKQSFDETLDWKINFLLWNKTDDFSQLNKKELDEHLCE